MLQLSRFVTQGASGPFAAIGQVLWVLQIALVIHAYRTGRPYWWIWVLIGAPVVGGLAYVIVELLPGIGSPRGFAHALKPRRWRIADLRARLEESESVTNRMNLAEELYAAGEFREAHDIAEGCLQGVFKDDARTMTEVARYKNAIADYSGAFAILDRVDTTGNRRLVLELQLLKGDALTGLGRFAEAEAAYGSVVGSYIGEAPRAGIASLYEKTGRADEACELWREIRAKFRRASPAWRRSERPWYKMATSRIKAQKG